MADKTDPKVQAKIDWLKDVLKRVEFSDENIAALDERNKGQLLIAQLDDKKAGIREKMLSAEFTLPGKGGIGKKKMKLLSEEGDYRQEIDTVHHGPKLLESVDGVQAVELTKAFEEILKIQDALAGNPYYDPGEPDFTPVPMIDLDGLSEDEVKDALDRMQAAQELRDKEEREYSARKAECDKHVAEDLWHPLVREGVIPENLVPQQHSSVAQLFAASSEEYDKRLKEYSESLTEKDILAQKFDLGFKVAKAGLKFAGSVTGVAGAVGDYNKDTGVTDVTGEIATFIGHVETALTISEGLTKAILTDKDFTAVGQTIADTIVSAASDHLDPAAAKILGTCVSNGARMVNISQKVKDKDYAGAFEDLIGGIASELESWDPNGDDGAMTEIAGALTKACAGLVGGGKIGTMVVEGKSPTEVMQEMMTVAESIAGDAVKGVPKTAMEEFNSALADVQELQEVDEERETQQDIISDKFTPEKLKQLREREAEADRVAAEKAKLSVEQEIAAGREDFEVLLRTGLAAPTDDQEEVDLQEYLRSESIEVILAIQARNAATFKFCETIASKGIGFVTKIFPPAGIAEACMTLALTIKDAVEKAEELIIWRENVEDALSAHSAQADAMLNRKGLQNKQTVQAGIQAALDAAKVVAEVLKMTPAAPAAPIVTASIDATEAAIELADLLYTETQLARAWKIYQKAQSNPEDRYLARKAMRENPTLSKYAMAYGALQGDPIAVEGMRRCGLSKVTLANPDTNVGKVVNYLEVKYPDDPVLLRAVPIPDKWYPCAIDLTAKCWVKFYHAGIKDAELSDNEDISGISGALGRLEKANTEFDAALEDCVKRAKETSVEEAKDSPVEFPRAAHVTLAVTLTRLQDQLRSYHPRIKSSGEPHKSMATFVDALAAKSEQRVVAINNVVNRSPWEMHYRKGGDSTETEVEKLVKTAQPGTEEVTGEEELEDVET